MEHMELETLGHAAERNRKAPQVIEIGLDAIGAEPVLTINELKHFYAHDVVTAVVFLNELEDLGTANLMK